jgi:hypothetical protein
LAGSRACEKVTLKLIFWGLMFCNVELVSAFPLRLMESITIEPVRVVNLNWTPGKVSPLIPCKEEEIASV